MFELICIFFKKKFETFQKYLEENLKKRFIRKSQLLVKYSIFFMPKKNRIFHLFVDY